MAPDLKSQAKIEKRKKIEKDIRDIIIHDSRQILLRNLKLRQRREFSEGDKIRVLERFNSSHKTPDSECVYHLIEGVICQVTGSGYFVKGVNSAGKPCKDFINKAHIINGFVKLLPV